MISLSIPRLAILSLALVASDTASAQRDLNRTRADGVRAGQDRGGAGRGGGSFNQFGMGRPRGGSFAALLTPEFTRADMPHLVGRLDLDDMQAMIAETLLLDYESAFQAAVDKARSELDSGVGLDPAYQARMDQRRAAGEQLRASLTELRSLREGDQMDDETSARIRARFDELRTQMVALRPSEGEMEVLRDRFRTLGKAWDAQRASLRAMFVADMQAILTEPQLGSWPSFERYVRRRHTLGRGNLSGESVDLLLVLNEMGVGETERVAYQEVLDAYEIELDSALVARNEFLDQDREAIFDAMRAGDFDAARVKLREESKLRQAVRDVNESYATALTQLLADRQLAPGEAGFEERYFERAFPRIFNATVMQRSFEAVRRFEDIPVEFLEAIAGLEETYLVDLDSVNQRLLAATRAHEPDSFLNRYERRFNRDQNISRELPPDPIGALREERSELDARFRAQLESILTEEQIDALPSQREWRNFRGNSGDFNRRRQAQPRGGG